LSAALTNEERFVAACQIEGEAGVRQKLNTGRYGEAKTVWAGNWLECVESGKSDATKAQERNTGLLNARKPRKYLAWSLSLLLLVLVAGASVVLASR
jgi:hypothetical protein